MNYLKNLCLKMNLTSLLKTFGLYVLTLIAPIKGLILLTLIMVLLDTAFGLHKLFKLKLKFEFSTFLNMFLKMLFYITLIGVGYMIDTHIVGGVFPYINVENAVAKTLTLLFMWFEIKSMDKTNQDLGNPPLESKIKDLFNFLVMIKDNIIKLKK